MYRTQKRKSKLLWVTVALALDLPGDDVVCWAGLLVSTLALPTPDLNLSVEHDIPLDAAAYLLLHFCCNRCLLLPRLFPFNY